MLGGSSLFANNLQFLFYIYIDSRIWFQAQFWKNKFRHFWFWKLVLLQVQFLLARTRTYNYLWVGFSHYCFFEMHQDSDFGSSSTYKYYVEFGSRSSSLKNKFAVSVPVLKITPGLDPVLINYNWQSLPAKAGKCPTLVHKVFTFWRVSSCKPWFKSFKIIFRKKIFF
jgi:hypothetical protein